MTHQFVYVIKGLSKTYPGGKTVLKDIWLSFFPGAKIGIVGHNGAGKSTLLKIMAGLDKEFNGEAWAAEGIKVGFLPQEPKLDESKNAFDNASNNASDRDTSVLALATLGHETETGSSLFAKVNKGWFTLRQLSL